MKCYCCGAVENIELESLGSYRLPICPDCGNAWFEFHAVGNRVIDAEYQCHHRVTMLKNRQCYTATDLWPELEPLTKDWGALQLAAHNVAKRWAKARRKELNPEAEDDRDE